MTKAENMFFAGIQSKWNEIMSDAGEFKKLIQRDFPRDLMLRRYQMMAEGRVPVEDQIAHAFGTLRETVVSSWRAFVKRTIDVAVSVVGLILTAPLMVLIAIAIKLESPGPALYSQVRVGKKGKNFNIYKFRSMRLDAETKTGPVWAAKNDSRITKVGNFLRTSHLDELPQFFNVISGEMSLVGPRPERPHFVKELRKVIPHYDRRLYAKPGITGLAQIKRSYDESIADVKKKLRYDILYVKRMCPVLDIKVVFMTVLTVVLRTGR